MADSLSVFSSLIWSIAHIRTQIFGFVLFFCLLCPSKCSFIVFGSCLPARLNPAFDLKHIVEHYTCNCFLKMDRDIFCCCRHSSFSICFVQYEQQLKLSWVESIMLEICSFFSQGCTVRLLWGNEPLPLKINQLLILPLISYRINAVLKCCFKQIF